MIFLSVTDQTQRGLTRQCQKLLVTMDNRRFTMPEPRRQSAGWTGFAKQHRTDFGKRLGACCRRSRSTANCCATFSPLPRRVSHSASSKSGAGSGVSWRCGLRSRSPRRGPPADSIWATRCSETRAMRWFSLRSNFTASRPITSSSTPAIHWFRQCSRAWLSVSFKQPMHCRQQTDPDFNQPLHTNWPAAAGAAVPKPPSTRPCKPLANVAFGTQATRSLLDSGP